MELEKFNYRGSTFNKIYFSDIEDYLEDKGFDTDSLFDLMADDNEVVYVSNGFVRGLHGESEPGEWHHYFKKDNDGDFQAFKLQFN